MKINFDEVKEYRVVDAVNRYAVKLRYVVGSDYASCICPLPTHPQGDKERKFCVHLPSNRWQCKNGLCGAGNGVGAKWGDVVNFVALMEGYRGSKAQYLAGVKITEWTKKTAPQKIEARADEGNTTPSPHKTVLTSNSDSGKGYIHALDDWFDELFEIGPELKDDPFWKSRRNAVKSKVHESYLNGMKAAPAKR